MYIYQIPYKLDYKIDDYISIEIYSDDEFYINVGGECIIFPVDKGADVDNGNQLGQFRWLKIKQAQIKPASCSVCCSTYTWNEDQDQ